MEGHSGVGIAEIAILLIAGTDLPCHLFLAAPAAAKAFLNGGQRLGPDGIAAGFRQALHQARHLGIAAGDVIEQALQIGGHQNIHAGRSGLEEFPLGSISTGGQEIGQDVVLIGSADQSAHRQAHLLCIVARQNIAKIARRHTEVHLVAKAHLPCLEQLGVGGKVVNDLRHQTAPVDGVCTGQADVPLCQLGSNGRVAKDLLHAGLGIIEVTAHSVDRHIFAFLGHHLQALDLTGAARGEEHRDLHTRDIVVAIQRGLAGIAAGRHQDQCFLGAVKIFLCLHQQLRHQLHP